MRVPPTPLKKGVYIDVRSMIFCYVVALNVSRTLAEKGVRPLCDFFAGIARGYLDWLRLFNIDNQQLHKVFISFNAGEVQKKVLEIVDAICGPSIILPSESRRVIDLDKIWNYEDLTAYLRRMEQDETESES